MPKFADPSDYQRRLGRPVTADITEHLDWVREHPNTWVAETYTNAGATSARRQFKKLNGEFEIMTSKSQTPGHRDVLVKYTPNTWKDEEQQ